MRQQRVVSVGLATFGPLVLDGPDAGTTRETPKNGWDHVPLKRILQDELCVPVGVETDVNAAALAELTHGCAKEKNSVVYQTVGTGIGGGVVVGRQPIHGLMHPELGHMCVPRIRLTDGRIDDFPGVCRFHGDCLEGMVSAPALRKRLGVDPSEVDGQHPIWEMVGQYLALGLQNVILTVSPEHVVLGGGVLRAEGLLDRVRRHLCEQLNEYLPCPELTTERIEGYLTAPEFQDSGLMGAFLLAEDAKRAC